VVEVIVVAARAGAQKMCKLGHRVLGFVRRRRQGVELVAGLWQRRPVFVFGRKQSKITTAQQWGFCFWAEAWFFIFGRKNSIFCVMCKNDKKMAGEKLIFSTKFYHFLHDTKNISFS
jgi:hypothetical protein